MFTLVLGSLRYSGLISPFNLRKYFQIRGESKETIAPTTPQIMTAPITPIRLAEGRGSEALILRLLEDIRFLFPRSSSLRVFASYICSHRDISTCVKLCHTGLVLHEHMQRSVLLSFPVHWQYIEVTPLSSLS